MCPPALSVGSNCPFQFLDVYWSSPESGHLCFKSRRFEKTICSPSEGWWASTGETTRGSPYKGSHAWSSNAVRIARHRTGRLWCIAGNGQASCGRCAVQVRRLERWRRWKVDGGQGRYGEGQLKAQGPSRTCNESKEEEEERGLTKSWPTEKDWVSQVDASLEPFTTTHGFPARTVVRRRPNILHTWGEGGCQIRPVREDPDIWRPFR